MLGTVVLTSLLFCEVAAAMVGAEAIFFSTLLAAGLVDPTGRCGTQERPRRRMLFYARLARHSSDSQRRESRRGFSSGVVQQFSQSALQQFSFVLP